MDENELSNAASVGAAFIVGAIALTAIIWQYNLEFMAGFVTALFVAAMLVLQIGVSSAFGVVVDLGLAYLYLGAGVKVASWMQIPVQLWSPIRPFLDDPSNFDKHSEAITHAGNFVESATSSPLPSTINTHVSVVTFWLFSVLVTLALKKFYRHRNS